MLKDLTPVILIELKKQQGKINLRGEKATSKRKKTSKLWSRVYLNFEIQYIPRAGVEVGEERNVEWTRCKRESATGSLYCISYRVVLREEIVHRRIKEVKEKTVESQEIIITCKGSPRTTLYLRASLSPLTPAEFVNNQS